jgi:hypothetical protein
MTAQIDSGTLYSIEKGKPFLEVLHSPPGLQESGLLTYTPSPYTLRPISSVRNRS